MKPVHFIPKSHIIKHTNRKTISKRFSLCMIVADKTSIQGVMYGNDNSAANRGKEK